MLNEDVGKLKIERKPQTSAPARKNIVRIGLAAAGIVLGWAVYPYVMNYKPAVEVETQSVVAAYPSQAFTLLNATGYVVAQRKAAVASKATGRLDWLGVTEGSRVKAGEVIARLEKRDVSASEEQAQANVQVAGANLEQARAELRDAEREMKRARDLVAKNFVSQSAFDAAVARDDKAKAAVDSAQAAVAVARANLRGAQVAVDQTLIRAPFDGVVLTKTANVGDVVTPFSSALDAKGAVVTMADMSTLEVEADVSESSLHQVQVGQPCEIQLDALPDRRFKGVVSRMVPTVDRAKATVTVKVRFAEDDARILPEMSAKVAFLTREVGPEERKPLTVIQPAAITARNGSSVVFVVYGDKVKQTAIVTARKVGDAVEVAAGVKAGDKVVLNPPPNLADGATIKLGTK